MRIRHLVALVVLAIAGMLAFDPLADGASPTLSFVVVEGSAITVPASSVTADDDYDIRCPKGYIATGHGVSLATSQLVFADPDPGARGFSFSFLNTGDSPIANVSASVVCVRGRGVRVRAASLSQEDRRRAVEQARASLRR